jgi:predicted esterase
MRVAVVVLAGLVAASAGAGDVVKCASDPEMTYVVLLPEGYTKDRVWPVLFVFDPRARGEFAANLFSAAVRDFGWIVVSSNNTRSDGPFEPNARAANAMWPDVLQRFSVDRRRIYASGFSGGAILAWVLGENTGALAGIIGVGGRMPDLRAKGSVPFDWYGIAGETDFNLIEMQFIDERLAAAGTRRRLEVFEGGHRWAPPEFLRHAIEWMELRAMERALRGRDDVFIARVLAEEMATAASARDDLAALRRYEAIARTFRALADVAEAEKRAASLHASPGMRALLADERRARKLEEGFRARLPQILRRVLDDETVAAPMLIHELQIASLQEQARDRSYGGRAAARMLETIRVQFEFYLPPQVSGRRLAVVKTVADALRKPR